MREQAAIFTETRGSDPALRRQLLRLANDPSGMVRFQAALSIGALSPAEAPDRLHALIRIAKADAADPWTRAAVLSSLGGSASRFLEALIREPALDSTPEGRPWVEDAAALVAARNRPGEVDAAVGNVVDGKIDPGLAAAAFLGLKRGLERAGVKGYSFPIAQLEPLFDRAAEVASGPGREAERVDSIRLLALAPPGRRLAVLPDLLDANQPPAVQLSALRGLAESTDPEVGRVVTDHWKSLSPALRREAAEVLLSRPERTAALLDAVLARRIAPSDLEPARRAQLVAHPRADLRRRAADLLGPGTKSDRAAVVRAFRPALETAGDRARGRAVFLKVCSTCHRAEGVGAEVGPNLATVAGRSPEDLLVQILDPNREVAPGFVNYNVATTDGRVVSGLVAEETATSVVLKRAEGVTEVVPRARIESLRATGLSVMPEGLENGLSTQDVADVVAFIRGIQAQPAAEPAR